MLSNATSRQNFPLHHTSHYILMIFPQTTHRFDIILRNYQRDVLDHVELIFLVWLEVLFFNDFICFFVNSLAGSNCYYLNVML